LAFPVETCEFPTGLRADGKNSLSIYAWNGAGIAQWSCGQLRRFPRCFAEQAILLWDGPDLCLAVVIGLKDEILPVPCPIAATFLGWITPAWQQGMKMTSVGLDFPQRR